MSKNNKKPSEESIPSKLQTVHTTFKQAFEIQKTPFPWGKAFSAGLAAALPVFIGMLFGNLEYGLLAGIGAFSYLYVFDIPYVQRAKKIFFAMLGISLAVFLGTLLAPYPFAVAIMMGIIGAAAIFIFNALKITGPSALFFVLSYAIATGMPIDPSLAPMRGGFVLLGGALSWVICMLGWFIQPHGPEINAVKKVYMELARFTDSIGTENFNDARKRMVLALKTAENTLLAGYSPKRSTDSLKRLFLLNEHANRVFLDVLDLSLEGYGKLPSELGQSVRALANTIGTKTQNDVTILQPDLIDQKVENLFVEIYNADAIMNEPVHKIQQEVFISKPSLKMVLLGAFDKNSIVFLTSIRYGIVLTFAAIIAYSFDFNRSYWIPLSCAAVMSGATIIATFHRTVQRMFGTIIGLLIASLILSIVHNGYMIALIILCLTFMTELFIVRNYGLAAMFFTPSALIMAEYTTGVFDFTFFATVRLTDIVLGSIIGLVGASIVGSSSASKLLNHFIAKTIRSQGQFFLMLFSENNSLITYEESSGRSKMQTNLTNLLTVYNTALGELFSNKKRLELFFWPVIFSIEQIGHYLDSSLKYDERPVLAEKDIAQLLYVFEMMAIAAEKNQPTSLKDVPEIKGFPNIQKEILDLQKALQFGEKMSH